MKYPILAGMLNVLMPGLGFVYLRKWRLAVTYFLGMPLYLLMGIVAAFIMTTVPSIPTGQLQINIGAFILWGVALLYILWDLFTTPYFLAKGIDAPKNARLAILLNLALPGLGFIYLKSWFYVFAYLLWVPFVVLMVTAVSSMLNLYNEVFASLYLLAMTIAPRVYAYMDMIGTTKETIQEIETARAALTDQVV